MRKAALLLAIALAAAPVAAQPGGARQSAPEQLIDANAALDAGDHARAAAIAFPIARDSNANPYDRAEAWRVLGLAQFHLGQHTAARASFKECLLQDPDCHLDPALVPPGALNLFDTVRAKQTAQIAASRPRVRKRSKVLAFVPLASQWQNGDHAKMWILAGTGAVLLAANITSYVLLKRWCDNPQGTCDEGDPGQPGYTDHLEEARTARVVNVVSLVGLIVLGTYSVIDGYRTYAQLEREEAQAQSAPAAAIGFDGDGVWVSVGRSF